METLSGILEPFLRDLGIEKSIRQYRAVGLWPEIVGERIASVTEARDLQRGKLFVTVKKDVWRHELIYHKSEIINKINERLGECQVQDIVFI